MNCYSNLIVDVKLNDGPTVQAFCPNPDRVNKLYNKGAEVWITPNRNNTHKVKHEVILVNDGEGLVMTNTSYIPELFMEAFENGIIEPLNIYDSIEDLSEDTQTRLSFKLSNSDGKECYVYVCGIYNTEDKQVLFPSFVDLREFLIYSELREIRKQGIDTFFIILTVRSNKYGLKFCWNLDAAAAAKAFDEARNGLKFLCYSCNVSDSEIEISKRMKIEF